MSSVSAVPAPCTFSRKYELRNYAVGPDLTSIAGGFVNDETKCPIEDKVAVVTGASRGLGLRICEAFIREGGKVALISRSAGPLQSAAAEFGPAAKAFVTDISDPAAVRHSMRAIAEHFGAVDVLVNNAALGHLQRVEEADDALLQLEVNTNLLGPIYCIRSRSEE